MERTDGLALGGWSGARTTADGGLRIVIVGAPPFEEGDPCTAEYTAAASETASEVEVTITARSPKPPAEYGCNSVGYIRLLDVALDEPLGARMVLFEPYGETEEVFDGSALLEPTAPPDGWDLRSEEPWNPDPNLGSAWRTTWGEAPEDPTAGVCTPGTAPVSLIEGRADVITFFTGKGTVAGQYEVRGHPATHLTGGLAADAAIVWTEGSSGYSLTTGESCSGDSQLAVEELVEFANSLRSPETEGGMGAGVRTA